MRSQREVKGKYEDVDAWSTIYVVSLSLSLSLSPITSIKIFVVELTIQARISSVLEKGFLPVYSLPLSEIGIGFGSVGHMIFVTSPMKVGRAERE